MPLTCRIVAVSLLAAVLAGCSWMPFVGNKDDDFNDEVETTEQILYRQAQSSLKTGNYQAGITRLQRLEARFPFGRYAEQAQLELIYAHYMAGSLDAAKASADRFIRLHPQHPNADYAQYMLGLTAFSATQGFLDRFFKSDPSKRDTTGLREALVEFSKLLARYPDSDFAKDARFRMIHMRNVLAQSEVNIASYYMSRGAYVAASNRARRVVEEFSQTPAVPDALSVLIESNWNLGLTDAANDALRVLAINYPTYPGFDNEGNLVLAKAIQNRDRSWLNMVTFGLVDRPGAPPPLEIKHPEGFVPPQPETEIADEPKKPWYKRLPSLG